MQTGRLGVPFPARSVPSAWGPPDREETGPTRTGSGLAARARCNARAKRWNQAQVPTGFRFAVKAPDGIEGRLGVFEERVRALGDRLGCVRVVVERPRDDSFLDLLLGSSDPGIRYALDLRDPTWDGVEERLAEAGAVRVGDTTGRAGWAYLRFRELRYGTEQLDRIASELRELARAHVETFAFFRHGERPDAPAAAVQVATACRLT